jgi:hypothetical protein
MLLEEEEEQIYEHIKNYCERQIREHATNLQWLRNKSGGPKVAINKRCMGSYVILPSIIQDSIQPKHPLAK